MLMISLLLFLLALPCALPYNSQFVFARLITFCNFVTEWLFEGTHRREKNKAKEFFDDFHVFFVFCFEERKLRLLLKFIILFFTSFSRFGSYFLLLWLPVKRRHFLNDEEITCGMVFAVKLVQRPIREKEKIRFLWGKNFKVNFEGQIWFKKLLKWSNVFINVWFCCQKSYKQKCMTLAHNRSHAIQSSIFVSSTNELELRSKFFSLINNNMRT